MADTLASRALFFSFLSSASISEHGHARRPNKKWRAASKTGSERDDRTREREIAREVLEQRVVAGPWLQGGGEGWTPKKPSLIKPCSGLSSGLMQLRQESPHDTPYRRCQIQRISQHYLARLWPVSAPAILLQCIGGPSAPFWLACWFAGWLWWRLGPWSGPAASVTANQSRWS